MQLLSFNTVRLFIALLALVIIPLDAKGAMLCIEHNGPVNLEYERDGCSSCPDEQQTKSTSDNLPSSDLCCIDVPLFTQSVTINKPSSLLEDPFSSGSIPVLVLYPVSVSSIFNFSPAFPDTPNHRLQNVNLLKSTILLI